MAGKADKLADIHTKALAEFDLTVSAGEEERVQALADRRFYSIAGAMWEGKVGQQFANRPQIEVNKVHLGVIRIINEYRNNRITANFTSRTGEEGDELADLCDGLYRADKQDSVADEAMDNAFEEGVGGGFGAWRLCTEYEDEYSEDDDRQRIRFDPIYDADSTVYFDVNAKRQDKSDAKHCFVLTGMTREAYVEEYEDDPQTWAKSVSDTEFDWSSTELVYVAEYYKVEDGSETIHTYRTVGGNIERHAESKLTDEKRAAFNDVGTILVSSKKIKVRKVRKYILSGGGVLEDCGYIAGTEIPIIPFYGKRWFVDGKERFMGHVRLVKDAQRLKNMQLSVLAESAASGGEEIPIFTPEQTAGFSEQWANKAIDRPAFLNINSITGPNGEEMPMGPLDYTRTASVPQAMAALLQIAETDIADLLGNQGGGEQIQSNISGKAVELIQGRLDMQSYIYLSNFAKSERRCGQVWLSMARDIYDEDERRMKVVDEQDEVDFVDIGRNVIGPDGKPTKETDLAKAKFDVAVDIGPASSSKRSATVRQLTEMMQVVADPTDQKVVAAMLLRNMEGDGLGTLREYFRKQLVSMGVEEPTEEEQAEIDKAQEGQQQQQDPQAVYLQSETQKNMAQTKKADADTVKSEADAQWTIARTAETLAGIDRKDQEAAIEAAKALREVSAPATP